MVLDNVEPKNIEATEQNSSLTGRDIFRKMNAEDVSDHVDLKKVTFTKSNTSRTFKYLSWPWAWTILNNKYENVDYETTTFPWYDNQGNRHDINYQMTPGGAYVETTLTIDGVSRKQSLPVMDSHNAAVLSPDAMLVNKTIQRCLVKTAALFGLGLNLYIGEDLPMTPEYVTDSNLKIIYQLIDTYAKLKNGSALELKTCFMNKYQVEDLVELTNCNGKNLIQYLTEKVEEINNSQEAK